MLQLDSYSTRRVRTKRFLRIGCPATEMPGGARMSALPKTTAKRSSRASPAAVGSSPWTSVTARTNAQTCVST